MSALGLGLFAALLWGLHDFLVRYLSRSTPLLAALLAVLTFGGIFQFGLLLYQGESLLVSPQALALSIGCGIFYLVGCLGLYYALARGPVRFVAPVIASFPVFSVGFELLDGAYLTGFQALAILAIIGGVGIVGALADHSEGESYPPLGKTLALSCLSAFCFAVSFKLGQMASELSGELPSTVIARGSGIFLLALVMMVLKRRFNPGVGALPLLGFVGFLDGLVLVVVLAAAPLPNPEYAAVGSSLFGLVAVVLAVIFLKEKMSLLQWAACLITCMGIAYLAV